MTQSSAPSDRGPYLAAALFCESVLDEKDNVKSLIRVMDRLIVHASGSDPPEVMPEFERDFTAILILKSGDARGPVPVKITLTEPSGLTRQQALYEGTIHMEGGIKGNNIVIRMRQRFRQPGPYWYNVYVSDRLVTKMPLEIIYTTTRALGQPRPGVDT